MIISSYEKYSVGILCAKSGVWNGVFRVFPRKSARKKGLGEIAESLFSLAQRRGFEPPDTFPHHTISNRAP